jgi:hypothetical protein
MLRKLSIFILVIAILESVRSAAAQQAKKVSRIGYLTSTEPVRDSTRSEAIRLALRELGYVEGQNITMSTDMRRGSSIGSSSLRPGWCVSRLMFS